MCPAYMQNTYHPLPAICLLLPWSTSKSYSPVFNAMHVLPGVLRLRKLCFIHVRRSPHLCPLLKNFLFQLSHAREQHLKPLPVQLARTCDVTAHLRQQLLVDCEQVVESTLVDVQGGEGWGWRRQSKTQMSHKCALYSNAEALSEGLAFCTRDLHVRCAGPGACGMSCGAGKF